MKRERTNKIRYIIEELIPPALRDTRFFAWLMSKAYSPIIYDLAAFRARAHTLSEEEYKTMYEQLERVHSDTDNSAETLERIRNSIVGDRICDVGCGTGFTLDFVTKNHDTKECHGVDFLIPEENHTRYPNLTFHAAPIEKLPFPNQYFDTVICTHTLEHILSISIAVKELRRICKKRLILVVPKEREGKFTFNPHFHFFPYAHSFLRALAPVPENAHIEEIGRDFFYKEDRE